MNQFDSGALEKSSEKIIALTCDGIAFHLKLADIRITIMGTHSYVIAQRAKHFQTSYD